jgi:SulP family sulfate permease
MSEQRWFRLLPEWLVSCRADWLRPGIVADLTTGAVIVPKAMAYAMMAGLPVHIRCITLPSSRAADYLPA